MAASVISQSSFDICHVRIIFIKGYCCFWEKFCISEFSPPFPCLEWRPDLGSFPFFRFPQSDFPLYLGRFRWGWVGTTVAGAPVNQCLNLFRCHLGIPVKVYAFLATIAFQKLPCLPPHPSLWRFDLVFLWQPIERVICTNW